MKRLIAIAASLLVIAACAVAYAAATPAHATVRPLHHGGALTPLSAVPTAGISASIVPATAADAARAMDWHLALIGAEHAISATDAEVSTTPDGRAIVALARFNGRLVWMAVFDRGIRNNPPPGYPDLEATRLVVVTDAVSGAAMQAYSAGPIVVLATAVPRAMTAPLPTITTR